MSKMTLREVCETVGVTRRAVQGYENAGLVSATSRNERGYLLYDEEALEKIKKIRLFQEMGFTIREICELDRAPKHVLKAALEMRVEKLQMEHGRVHDMIGEAKEMIREL